jgi:hypothetical protein
MIFCAETEYQNIDVVRAAYLGAAEIVEVAGGWAVFETDTDYETWQNQV